MPPSVNYKTVQTKLLQWKILVNKLQDFFIKIEEDPTNDQFEYASNAIEVFGRTIQEICKTAFPNDQDQDNDPFNWIEYGFIPGASPAEQRRHEINHVKEKIDAVQSFTEKKIEKLSLYDDVISEKDKGDSKNYSPPSINIEKFEGKLVAGDEINIRQITNILHDIEKEIEESNLSSPEKEDFKKLIKEGSGIFEKIGNSLAKYGGRFIGHAGRSFAGFPDGEE